MLKNKFKKNSFVNDVLASVITGCPKVIQGLKAPSTWGVLGEYTC